MYPHVHLPQPAPLLRHAVQGLLLAAVALLGGCGGGGGASTTTATPSTTPASSPVVPYTPPPPPPVLGSGPTYYFSACADADAHASCVNGNNNNAGTNPNAPRYDLTGFDVNNLPAGSNLLFARGGVWHNFSQQIYNLNVTPAQPLIFDAYTPTWGGSARPWLKSVQTVLYAFEFGAFGADRAHGGYAVRNLKLDGQQTTYNSNVAYMGRAFNIRGWARDVNIENLEITGFAIAVIGAQIYVNGTGITAPIYNVALRNNNIHHNTAMGFLGEAQGLEISGNTFNANNMSPLPDSSFNHAIYLSGHGRDAVLRNNTFTNNSVSLYNGINQCVGGNVTAHGQWDNLLIEGNTITQVESNGSCYGFSITPGPYGTPEYFRGLVIRSNTVTNLGGCAICVGAATNPLIEGNLLINTNNRWMSGVLLGGNVQTQGQYGSDLDTGATVRNNTYCSTYGPADGLASNVLLNPTNASSYTLSGNLSFVGAANATPANCSTLPAI